MTANEFKLSLERLGLSRSKAGALLGYTGSHIGRMRCGKTPVPIAVAILVRALLAGVLTQATIEAMK